MNLDPCPFEAFKTTLRCDLAGQGPRCYRFVHADPEKEVMAFFDLEDRKFSLDNHLLIKTYDELKRLPDDAMEIVPDPFPTLSVESARSAGKTETQLAKSKRKGGKNTTARNWENRWDKVKGLVSRNHIDWFLLGDHGFTDLYINPVWRHRMIDDFNAGTNITRYETERVLCIFIRYGGSYEALRPRTRFCGKPGFARWQLSDALKSGPSDEEQRRRGRARHPGLNRVDAFWIRRMRMAIGGIIDDYKAEAGSLIRNRMFFLEYFHANCCWSTELADGTRIPVDVRTIPSNRALIHHRDSLLLEYPVLQVLDSELGNVRGGNAKALTYGVLDIADMDGTEIPEVCLVVADDQSKDVSRDNCRYCGPPTVMLGICRKSNAFVGWLVSAGEESAQQYQHLLYNILTPKEERLLQLGLDPANYPGIVTGQFDQIIMDRGPGASHKMLDWTVDGIKIDVRLTRAAAPQDKGGIEGGIGRFKQQLRADGTLRARGPMGELLHTRILNRLRALPAGIITLKSIQHAGLLKRSKRESKDLLLITPKAFEILLIEVINKLNLRRAKKPTVLDERMFLAHVEPIPARLLVEHQRLRRGNAALARPPVDLLASIVEPRYCTVAKGRITVDKLSYGSPSSVPDGEEGARALLQYAQYLVSQGINPSDAKIEVYVKPYKNFVWWRRGEGDWVLLAPVEESAEHCNPDRDRIEVQAYDYGWNIDQKEARLRDLEMKIAQRKPRQPSKLPADALVELQNIRNTQLAAWHGAAPADKDTRKALQQAEKEERCELAAAAAGVPEFPKEPLPIENREVGQREAPSLDDYFAEDE
ncbi:hypothetical protein [Cupriavidus taiwanensis]|uniref:hypothetical protein n=1 Tax=Cupriavidus taiwanensis TaxID=164546 RepID=UPI000E183B7F|nr:hypothetical protein [Cupriavidus taiwanensis]SPC18353.1 hypothetical protein CT19431_MP30297 [Cupriavidus taiwanensis]